MSDKIEYGRSWWEVMKELADENTRLKADVVELADALKLASEVGIKVADEVTRLKAEVERLRKAGDGLYGIAYNAGPGEGRVEKLDAWRAAKEGKQP